MYHYTLLPHPEYRLPLAHRYISVSEGKTFLELVRNKLVIKDRLMRLTEALETENRTRTRRLVIVSDADIDRSLTSCQ